MKRWFKKWKERRLVSRLRDEWREIAKRNDCPLL